MSLSPRPERLTSTTARRGSVGASRMACRDRVRALERGDDALLLGEHAERRDRLLVADRLVGHAAGVAEIAVLRPDARIVEAGRDRVRDLHLPGLVLQQVRLVAVQHADVTGR